MTGALKLMLGIPAGGAKFGGSPPGRGVAGDWACCMPGGAPTLGGGPMPGALPVRVRLGLHICAWRKGRAVPMPGGGPMPGDELGAPGKPP